MTKEELEKYIANEQEAIRYALRFGGNRNICMGDVATAIYRAVYTEREKMLTGFVKFLRNIQMCEEKRLSIDWDNTIENYENSIKDFI